VTGHLSIPAEFEPDPLLSDAPLDTRVAPSWKAMTSGGSTGRPKLIVSADRGEFDRDRRPLEMQPGQVQLVAGPLYHNAPFTSMFGVFLGHHLVILEKFSPEAALSAIQRHRIQFAQFVPTMLLRMWRALEPDPQRFDLSSLETVWHMAAPCPAWLKEIWIRLVGPEHLYELYGGTESLAVTHISGSEWLEHRGSVGRPVLGEIKICDAEGNDSPPGVEGEIFMRRGEHERSYEYIGAEARSLPGGWESLGDLGWVDEDGYLYVTDRRTDMILSGGANIYPAEVEAAICEHPGVLSAAVVGLPDGDLGHRVHAVVQTIGSLPADQLRIFLEARIVRYKIPRSFRFTDEPLRDDAGKVRRSAVRDREIALQSGAVTVGDQVGGRR
jgi:bile acid-coenzyme A ligase